MQKIEGPQRLAKRAQLEGILTYLFKGRQGKELKLMQDSSSQQWKTSQWKDKLQAQRQLAFNLKEAERKHFAQLAKGNYIHLSDRNTKLYHSILRRNKARGSITCIQLEDDTMSTTVSSENNICLFNT